MTMTKCEVPPDATVADLKMMLLRDIPHSARTLIRVLSNGDQVPDYTPVANLGVTTAIIYGRR
jgi:hypothetical protein